MTDKEFRKKEFVKSWCEKINAIKYLCNLLKKKKSTNKANKNWKKKVILARKARQSEESRPNSPSRRIFLGRLLLHVESSVPIYKFSLNLLFSALLFYLSIRCFRLNKNSAIAAFQLLFNLIFWMWCACCRRSKKKQAFRPRVILCREERLNLKPRMFEVEARQSVSSVCPGQH